MLRRLYSSSELTELLAFEALKHKEQSKEDVRHAIVMKALEGLAGGNSRNTFLIDWAAKDENESLTPYEIGMKEKQKWGRM